MFTIHVTTKSETYDLTCIYAPNIPLERNHFFEEMKSFCTTRTVLIGDFNSVTSSSDRLSGNLDSTSQQLNNLLNGFNLIKPLGSHQQVFTYQHPSITTCKSWLDHVYMNFDHEWMGYSLPVSYSDHYLIGIFVPYPDDVGPRPWRFPNDLLEDESFQQQIDLILQTFSDKDSGISWESVKSKI